MTEQTIAQKNPSEYLKIFFRRKWFIIIPTVIGLVGGIIAGNVLPKVYRASTLILVEEGRIINPLIQGLAVSTSTAQRLNVLREQILGWDRMVQLIKTLDLAKDVRSQEQFENLVKKLRRNIGVELRGSNLVTISYTGPDRVEDHSIVKTITDIFIAENLRQQNKETDDAVTFINEEVALYQKKLKQSEVAAMEDQLKKLLVDSTPKHPLVIELKTKIAQARSEMDQGNFDVDASAVAGSNGELKTMKEELKAMKEELSKTALDASDAGANRAKMATNTNEKLYKLLLLERMDKVQARDENVNQKLYNELLSRLETAKITRRLESSKEGTRYTVLDPARLPIKPVKPNKLVTMFMGFMLGASAGIGLVFLMEAFDRSFLGVDEARAFLTLPIFGAVSKIITQEDIATQKLRNTRITAASVVTGVVLLVVIIFNVILGS